MLLNVLVLALVLLPVSVGASSDKYHEVSSSRTEESSSTKTGSTKTPSPENPKQTSSEASSSQASSSSSSSSPDKDAATKTSSSSRPASTTSRGASAATAAAWNTYMDKVKGIIALPHNQLMEAGQHRVSYPKNGSYWVANTTNVMQFSSSPPTNMYFIVAAPGNASSPVYSMDDGSFFTKQDNGSETQQSFNYDGPNTPGDGYFLLLLFSDCNTTTLLDTCVWAVSDRFAVKDAGTAVQRKPVGRATRRTSVGMGLVLAAVVTAAAVATVC